MRRKLEKELGRSLTQDELFKATHTWKKKNVGDPDVWIEPRVELTYTQPVDSRGMTLSQEKVERMWLDSVGDPSRYETAYGMPQ